MVDFVPKRDVWVGNADGAAVGRTSEGTGPPVVIPRCFPTLCRSQSSLGKLVTGRGILQRRGESNRVNTSRPVSFATSWEKERKEGKEDGMLDDDEQPP